MNPADDSFITEILFNELPNEMKLHILEQMRPFDLAVARGVCRNWNYVISCSTYFMNEICLTIRNRETVDHFINLNSFMKWRRIKVKKSDSYDLDQEILSSIAPEMKSRLPPFHLTLLALWDLRNVQHRILLNTIASCIGLRTLELKNVRFQVDEEETSPETITNAKMVAKHLKTLKLQEINVRNMLNLFNTFLLESQKLKNLAIMQGQSRDFDDHNFHNINQDLTTFLARMKTLLTNNSGTLTSLKFSLSNGMGMLTYYQTVFSTFINLEKKFQLKHLSLYLHPPGFDSLGWNDTYFFENVWDDNIEDDDEDLPINPTQIFNMWRDFIVTQTKLKTLRIPYIELSRGPFDQIHDASFCELLASIPSSIEDLDASLEQRGVPRQKTLSTYKQLTTLKTKLNLRNAYQILANNPQFLDPEHPLHSIPKFEKIRNLDVIFTSGNNISYTTTTQICQVFLKVCPIELKKLIVKGSIEIGDVELQLIISSLPLLEVLKLKCPRIQTDYGITGISKKWLAKTIRGIQDFPMLISSEDNEKKPEFVGNSLSKLERLQILKLKNLEKLSDIGIYYGLKLPQLEKLHLSTAKPYNKITDWGLQQLATNCPVIESIRICVGELTSSDGVNNFVSSLKRIRKTKSFLQRIVKYEFVPSFKILPVE